MNYAKVYIIIVTYNAMKWAEKCFSSLRKSSIPIQCIVVDNGSVDGTQDYIRKNFPEVELIQNEKNLGFGKANNIGIEKAYQNGADFFYLMNQDAWIFEDSIAKLLNVYENYANKDEIGILSPIHLDGTEKKLDIFLDKYIASNFEKTRMISDFYLQNIKPYYEINFVNAAHWFIPKSTIETVGGFNPYFFHYGEDNEYVNRVHFHQKKILLCAESKVVHDGKQILRKVDYSIFEDLSIETRMMNPATPNSTNSEVIAHGKSTFMAMLLLRFIKYRKLSKKLKKLTSDYKTIKKIKQQVAQKAPSFLSI